MLFKNVQFHKRNKYTANLCYNFMINTRENISKLSTLDNIYDKKSYSRLIFPQNCNTKIFNFIKGYTTNFCYDFIINTHENISKTSAFDNIYKKKPYS